MLISLLLTQLAVGHDLTESGLPVDATSFCRAMFIDMADKQPIAAQPNAMLTMVETRPLQLTRTLQIVVTP